MISNDHDRRPRPVLTDPLGKRQSVHPSGEADVNENDIGFDEREDVQGLMTVTGLRNHAIRKSVAQQCLQEGSEFGVVFDNQGLDHLRPRSRLHHCP